MNKYGFVYLWFDRKHKRFYIGSHWGTEDDGYVCSSRWMRKSYRRRTDDFKRRILSRIYTNRSDLLDEEHKFLTKIKDYEIGKRYYNLTTHRNGHWSSDEGKSKTVSEKLKSAWNDDNRKKQSEAKLGVRNPMKRPEVAEKVASKNRGIKRPQCGRTFSTEDRIKQSMKMKGRTPHNKGTKMTTEERSSRKLSSSWEITCPTGEIITTNNLKLFCDQHSLTRANMAKVAKGERTNHKNYQCRKLL